MTVFDRLRFHRPVKPVYVSVTPRILSQLKGKAKGDWSISVHESDLLSRFGKRATIHRLINTDLNATVRHAVLHPPLSEDDVPVLRDLVHRYDERLSADRRPLVPPVEGTERRAIIRPFCGT